nr:SPOR domain-containing protein [Sphingomonas morindae]
MPLPYAAPAPAPYAAPPAAPASATPADADAADALASALSGEAGRVEATGGGYRVVTGPYPDDASRAAALARLRARGYQGAVLLDQTLSDGTTPP